jgi:hypothetical protein
MSTTTLMLLVVGEGMAFPRPSTVEVPGIHTPVGKIPGMGMGTVCTPSGVFGRVPDIMTFASPVTDQARLVPSERPADFRAGSLLRHTSHQSKVRRVSDDDGQWSSLLRLRSRSSGILPSSRKSMTTTTNDGPISVGFSAASHIVVVCCISPLS